MNAAADGRVEFDLNEFATVGGVAVATAATAGTVQLTIEVEPSVWETIDLLQLFHLGWAERREGSVSGSEPVQIELRLDPAVAAEVGPLPGEPAGLADAIAGAPAGSPLRANTSWYAVSVTEAVDLPPELAELGEVRSGFATTWGDPAPDSSDSA